MEAAFDADFSGVRVHDGDVAAQSARAARANAYTVGSHVVFGTGRYRPDTPSGQRVLAHELTHVMQQGPQGNVVQRDEDPRALTGSVDPLTLGTADLDDEVRRLRAWLSRQTTSTPDRTRLAQALQSLEAELGRRAGNLPQPPPVPPAPDRLVRPPVPIAADVPATSFSAAHTTAIGVQNAAPDPAIRQRLLQIVTQGGPMPPDTRVIGAAIVEVEGFRGAREIRAISAQGTDALGQGAPVFHATTPGTRVFTAARSIAGGSARREFPFSHVNDAEIKLFEYIAANMPANATGRITIVTMRSRNGGAIVEPIPACSSCTNAFFELAGRYRGRVQVGSYAATHPTGTVDLGGGRGQATTQTVGTQGDTTARIGTPDMRGLNVGGPSARGVGIVAGLQVIFMGANFVLGIANDAAQQRRAEEALARIEPGLRARRSADPSTGVLLVFFYTQVQAPPESLIQPGPVFSHIEYDFGRTRDEAWDAWRSAPQLRRGPAAMTREQTQEVWIPPLVAPSVRDIRTPFPSAALATFASGRTTLQDVEWGGITGFDDEGTSSLTGAAGARFLVLRVPSTLSFFASGSSHDVSIPVEERAAHAGGNVPVVNLDPSFPGSNVAAACLFPADDATASIFATARATRDNLGLLRGYPNFRRVRWARPEDIDVVERI